MLLPLLADRAAVFGLLDSYSPTEVLRGSAVPATATWAVAGWVVLAPWLTRLWVGAARRGPPLPSPRHLAW